MKANFVYILIAVVAVILVLGSNAERKKKPVSEVVRQYDRSDPKHPMHGMYSDSNCSYEDQQRGIYSCPAGSK